MTETENHEGYPRHREDVDEAIRKMNLSMESTNSKFSKKLFNFQVFVSALLLSLVLITSVSFAFTMRADREARVRAEERQILFEEHVTSILDSIEETQLRGLQQRSELNTLLDQLRDDLHRHDENL